ncbi:hypothetical protein RFI_09176 [Reticulomyxa filosa]|uniref:Uncharacterized protein n=1 Tax=Reticulomyxa filosa TaxID=46433 RepID=X6NQJ0_RETFI|nr:hypothetical protein RFI_09176 [Reticulomyxa filosa]|eukprot:ETO27954.1 hypothetical protein RFI_09176 [Reticulomyxa filosa]
MDPEFEKLAKKIEEQRKPVTEKDDSSNVFVIELEFMNSRELFRKLGAKTIGPKYQYSLTQSREVCFQIFFISIFFFFFFIIKKLNQADDIGNWISRVSKVPLSFSRNFELPPLQYVVTGVISVPVGLWFFHPLRKSMALYAMICLLVYGFVMAGGMFSIIREVPFKGEGSGFTSYISGGGRYQYAAEGYIIGGLS